MTTEQDDVSKKAPVTASSTSQQSLILGKSVAAVERNNSLAWRNLQHNLFIMSSLLLDQLRARKDLKGIQNKHRSTETQDYSLDGKEKQKEYVKLMATSAGSLSPSEERQG